MMDFVFGSSFVTGMDFLKEFEAAWVDLHNPSSRDKFVKLVTALISDSSSNRSCDHGHTGMGRDDANEGNSNSKSGEVLAAADTYAKFCRRQVLLQHSTNSSLRDTMCLLGVYAAYLIGAQDGRFRDAYDLLYKVHILVKEAREHAEVLGVEGDENSEEFGSEFEEEHHADEAVENQEEGTIKSRY